MDQNADFDGTLDAFRAACKANPKDIGKCQDLLLQLKLQMITFNLLPPFTEHIDTVRKKLLQARETLELGTVLAIDMKDTKSFERHFSQVKPYYHDFKHLLPVSARQWELMGANLLCLLSQNRIAEFHAELELIPTDNRENACIAFPIELEQSLMEGSYHKIFSRDVPRPKFQYFMGTLTTMVRERIAECSEKAYESVPLSEAPGLLLLDSETKQNESTLQDTITQRKWTVKDNTVYFPQDPDVSLDIPSSSLIQQTLFYATELERIV